jgi:hypothetical protein
MNPDDTSSCLSASVYASVIAASGAAPPRHAAAATPARLDCSHCATAEPPDRGASRAWACWRGGGGGGGGGAVVLLWWWCGGQGVLETRPRQAWWRVAVPAARAQLAPPPPAARSSGRCRCGPQARRTVAVVHARPAKDLPCCCLGGVSDLCEWQPAPQHVLGCQLRASCPPTAMCPSVHWTGAKGAWLPHTLMQNTHCTMHSRPCTHCCLHGAVRARARGGDARVCVCGMQGRPGNTPTHCHAHDSPHTTPLHTHTHTH